MSNCVWIQRCICSDVEGNLPNEDKLLNSLDYRALTANLDGVNAVTDVAVIANNRYFVAAPLICNILTGCEKFIPAFNCNCGNVKPPI